MKEIFRYNYQEDTLHISTLPSEATVTWFYHRNATCPVSHGSISTYTQPVQSSSNFSAELKCGVLHLFLVVFIKLLILGHRQMVPPVTNFPCRATTENHSGNLAKSRDLNVFVLIIHIYLCIHQDTFSHERRNFEIHKLGWSSSWPCRPFSCYQNALHSVTLFFTSSERDKPRKQQSLSISRPVSWKHSGQISLLHYYQPEKESSLSRKSLTTTTRSPRPDLRRTCNGDFA